MRKNSMFHTVSYPLMDLLQPRSLQFTVKSALHARMCIQALVYITQN
jgi:hypothetical protein